MGGLDRGVSRGNACNGHTEGRAARVIEIRGLEEVDRQGIASDLATDTDFQASAVVGRSMACTTFIDGHLDQPADTVDIKVLEGVVG